ncbi:copper homeostasis protein CutC [Gilvimarinus chinensis]|uniref:copper homeostasis protein CutC n=1 Tax=Gilvimarinus chinensis TaxID=396005 RepID=UPI0004779899|nr:copper homeostasis protein CutC [Gilvimarinus chinensis]
MSKKLLEVCVDSPRSLITAVEGGADRVELCSALGVGGLTPSTSLMGFAASQNIPVHVMIRPREGHFNFSHAEVELMLEDIAQARKYEVQGVVLGACQQHGELDLETLQKLIDAAKGLDLTLHRAFDITPDPFAALEQAIELGFNRILTSGQKKTAIEGEALIKKLVNAAGDRIEIMPGSGINTECIQAWINDTAIKCVHASCALPIPSAVENLVALGFEPAQGRRETNLHRVRELVNALV